MRKLLLGAMLSLALTGGALAGQPVTINSASNAHTATVDSNGDLHVTLDTGGTGTSVTITGPLGRGADAASVSTALSTEDVAVLNAITSAIVAGYLTPPLAITGSAPTDGSTTITAGGSAQNLFAGGTPTNGYLVCNPNSSDDLWVSDTTTAAANATGSFRVAANGGCFVTPPTSKPAGAVSVVGPTTGDKITARKY